MFSKPIPCFVSDMVLFTAAFFVRNAVVLSGLAAVAVAVFLQ